MQELVKLGQTDKGGDLYAMDLRYYVDQMQRLHLCTEKKNDFAVLCPNCKQEKLRSNPNYTKQKLWIDKDFKYGHCFRCNSVYISQDDSINTELKVEKKIDINNWSVCRLDHPYWSINLFDSYKDYDEVGMNYLIRQRHHYFKKLAPMLGIKFTESNPVIPFKYKGELIYYQLRLISEKSKIKYFSPPIEHKPAYIVEHGENKKFIIVEGTFDAIACLILYPEYTPFAVLGSTITEYQIGMLRSYVPEVIKIFMDNYSLSENMKSSIEQYLNYADIEIIPSYGRDPEEVLKEKIILDMV